MHNAPKAGNRVGPWSARLLLPSLPQERDGEITVPRDAVLDHLLIALLKNKQRQARVGDQHHIRQWENGQDVGELRMVLVGKFFRRVSHGYALWIASLIVGLRNLQGARFRARRARPLPCPTLARPL